MTKEDIINAYSTFIKQSKTYPSLEDLNANFGITRSMVRTHFVNLEGLKQSCRKIINDHILDVEFFDGEQLTNNLNKIKKFKRFVITTAVVNSQVDIKYFNSIKTYCQKENACLIILPSLMKGGNSKYTLDPILKNEVIVHYDLALNSNVGILGVANNAKSVDPITGLPRLGKRNGSLICASPKQNLKIIPTGINKLPHALMSTGSITKPNYTKSTFFKHKQDYLAENDHVLGCIIVELDNDELFHFRQTQADDKKGFTDLGNYYINGRKENYSPEALVAGDIHVTETCPLSEKGMFSLIKNLNIKKLIAHDIYTARSTNHHENDKKLFLAKRANNNELLIENEIKELSLFLKKALTQTKDVIIVRSNHDEFLDRYLESGEYVNHPFNHRIALKLAMHVIDGLNPLEESCKELGINKNVKWLKRDESYKIAGIELGCHGDKGANGSRGSAKSLEEGYGACVYGHTHTPNISRSAWCVGTNTITKPYYGSGPNSWLNTDCLVYSNGVRQLINKFDGIYTTKKF